MIADPPYRPLGPNDVKGSVWEFIMALGAKRDGTTYSSVVDIVPQSRQTLAPGGGFDIEVKGDFRISSLVLDVARDVLADFYLNDDTAPRWSTKDRLGFGGQFHLGDTTGRSAMRLWRLRVVASNQHATEQRDVRAWMVVQ